MHIADLIKSRLVDVQADILDSKIDNAVVLYLNPKTYLHYREQPELLEMVDGIRFDGILMRLLVSLCLLRGSSIPRQSFDMTSLAPKVFAYCVSNQKRVYIAGGKAGEAEIFCDKLRSEYPNLQIVGSSHGYQTEDEIIESVSRLAPEVVILGLGNLKQDSVAMRLKQSNSALYFTCGAFISQTAASKDVHFYPQLVNRLNLRWLYRMVTSTDVFLRVLVYYPKFLVVFVFDCWRRSKSG